MSSGTAWFRSSVLGLAVPALGLAATVVFFQGLRVFLLNHVYFNISLAHAVGWLAAGTLLAALALAAPGLLLRPRWRELYAALLLGAAFFAWVKSSFLGWDYGLFAGVAIQWEKYAPHGYADIAALMVIPAYAVIRRGTLLPRSASLMAFLVVVQLAGLLLLTPLADAANRETILDKRTVQLQPRKTEKLSRTSNVIILVIDTLQSDIVGELFSEHPGRREAFRGFTFYRDTAASSALTWVSVPNALTGTVFDNQVPYARYIRSAYETPDSALKNLREAGYYVELVPWGAATPLPPGASFLSNAAESLSPRLPVFRAITATALFNAMPQFAQQNVYDHVSAVVGDFFDPASESNIRFMSDIHRLPVELVDQPVAKLIHLRGPHIPLLGYGQHGLDYVSAAAGETLDAAEIVPLTRGNYKRVTAALLDGVGAYLAKLQQAGAHDNATIFVFGDHGAGRQGLRFRASRGWPAKQEVISSGMQAAAAAALAVKPPRARAPFVVSDAPVALSDVACTVNKSIVGKAASDCHSLFEKRPAGPRQRLFFDFLNTRFDAQGYFAPMTEYRIDGPVWLVSSWQRSGRKLLPGAIRNGAQPYEPGTRIDFGDPGSTAPYLDYGWREPDPVVKGTWTDGRSAQLTLPLRFPDDADFLMDIEMKAYNWGSAANGQRVIVTVNGINMAKLHVKERENFSVRIPKSAAAGSALSIRFALPDAVSQLAVFGRPDDGLVGAQLYGLTVRSAQD